MKRKMTLTVCGAVLLGMLGVWIALSGWEGLARARAKGGWETSKGVVTHSEVIGERAPHPEIQYRFTVNGAGFTGVTSLGATGFGNRASRRDEAVRIIANYPPGKSVLVYFNPENPSESAIKTSPSWSMYGQLGTGLALFTLSSVIVCAVLRKKQRSVDSGAVDSPDAMSCL